MQLSDAGFQFDDLVVPCLNLVQRLLRHLRVHFDLGQWGEALKTILHPYKSLDSAARVSVLKYGYHSLAVTVGKSFNLSGPQFPHLEHVDNNSAHFIVVMKIN